MRTTRHFFLAVLTIGAVLGGMGSAADPAPAKADDKKTPVYLPNGVTDAAGEVGYLTTPKGDGLVAVDLEAGKVLWETKDANQALVVDGTRLIARTGRESCRVVLHFEAVSLRVRQPRPRISTQAFGG